MAENRPKEDLSEFEKLAEPVTIIANYRDREEALLLSNRLQGRKKFFLLDENDSIIGQKHKFAKGDEVIRVNFNAPFDKIKEKVDEIYEEGEHIVVFPERHATGQLGLQQIHPLAARLARAYTGGRIMAVVVEMEGHNEAGQMELYAAPMAQLEMAADEAPDDASKLRLLLEEAELRSFDCERTLMQVLFDAAARYGMDKVVYTQPMPAMELSYKDIIQKGYALGIELGKRHKPGSRVGLMLPTSAATPMVFFACQFAGLVPAMINFTSGAEAVLASCATAKVEAVYSSRRLLEQSLPANRVADAINAQGNVPVVFLDDMRDTLPLSTKLKAWLKSRKPGIDPDTPGAQTKPEDEALLLFSSGSEGDPKTIVLTHRNLCSNIYQVLARLDVHDDEHMINILPVFHSFGMMGGVLLPFARGFKACQFPSPLRYRDIVELIRKEKFTCMFSTSTFFGRYGSAAENKEDMASLRLLVAGGEKLRDGVRELWKSKFGKDLYEGYGVTETSPAVSLSTEHAKRPGSIGLPMPGMQFRLTPQEGITEGGVLEIKGPNVMKGYLQPDGTLAAPPEGWHSTGDVVKIDKDGFLYIVGRVKRFAKIAGEMVPMVRVENALAKVKEDAMIAVIAVPDEERGEKLIAFSQDMNVTLEQMQQAVQAADLPALWAPQEIVYMEDSEFPLLGTGKFDYPTMARRYAAGGGVRSQPSA
ncbi:MAG: AMP-binding protein [Betaproteobacteria bacterium AqS2]|uniref:AMP-binding protein n=1 Tax=Candidatus Amphirhobacter heronislandensis TaxID=1732024 RepID=A0A930UHI7_9GAMM|nr:AMP-binding protein [Betaproteobacteria bacterium AqS2]